MARYLVADLGSSSVRVTLLDGALRALNTQTLRRSAGPLLDGEAEWAAVKSLLERAGRGAGRVDGIGVTALMGWIGVDEGGRAVTPCYTYLHRDGESCGRFLEKHGDGEVYPLCGMRVNAEWAAFAFAGLKRREPERYARVRTILSLKDFITMKLTGERAMDPTTASYTMLCDLRRQGWSGQLIQWLGLDGEKLPPLRPPCGILGTAPPRLAGELGLEGCPAVAVGSIDGSTGIFGAARRETGVGVSVMGTTDVCYLIAPRLCSDPARSLMIRPYLLPGLWLVGGPMGSFGGTADWLARRVAGGADLEDLTRLAADVPPGCGGMSLFPSLDGERAPFWNPAMPGSVLGMRREHGAGHLFRAVLEANGYFTRFILEQAGRLGIHAREMIAVGGGAGSDLWLQIKADITGLPWQRTAAGEVTTLGSALLVMMALGTPEEELPPLPRTERFLPCAAREADYRESYRRYMQRHDWLAALCRAEG